MEAVERPLTLRHSLSSPNVRRHRFNSEMREPGRSVAESAVGLVADKYGAQDGAYDMRVEDYACNICFEIAENAVVTSCGHLHCWTCLYRWLALPSQLACPICPVCKAGCDISTLTPIYGRGDHKAEVNTKARTFSTGSQNKPRNIFDQWLVPHIHPPTIPLMPEGETPARPTAKRNPPVLRKDIGMYHTDSAAPSQQSSVFGNTHPVVIFSAGITTLCGMQILNNGGFTATTEYGTVEDHTSKMMWLLAFAIIAGVWFH